jgi:hypothetical protein
MYCILFIIRFFLPSFILLLFIIVINYLFVYCILFIIRFFLPSFIHLLLFVIVINYLFIYCILFIIRFLSSLSHSSSSVHYC